MPFWVAAIVIVSLWPAVDGLWIRSILGPPSDTELERWLPLAQLGSTAGVLSGLAWLSRRPVLAALSTEWDQFRAQALLLLVASLGGALLAAGLPLGAELLHSFRPPLSDAPHLSTLRSAMPQLATLLASLLASSALAAALGLVVLRAWPWRRGHAIAGLGVLWVAPKLLEPGLVGSSLVQGMGPATHYTSVTHPWIPFLACAGWTIVALAIPARSNLNGCRG